MAFGVGSAKVTIAFGADRAMAIASLGFNVLNASVIGVYVGELLSAKYRFRSAGISQGAGKLANVAMPFSVAKFLANL